MNTINSQKLSFSKKYAAEAAAAGMTLQEFAAKHFLSNKTALAVLRRYIVQTGAKPESTGEGLLKQFAAVREAEARKYAALNHCDPETAKEQDYRSYELLGNKAGMICMAADHFDVGNLVQQTGTGAAAGGIFGGIVGALNSILSGLAAARWTGEQKDFAKLYMAATGRTKFDNNASVGAQGKALAGEPIEYGQHIPEATVYFTLKYGRPITNRAEALEALGESWTPGLWDRIYGKQGDWRNVFTRNGLTPPPTYVFGQPGIDYAPVLNALNNGTFKPEVPAGAGGALQGVSDALDLVLGMNSGQGQQAGQTQTTQKTPWLLIAAAVLVLILILRK